MMKKATIDIVLPNRIGDAILTLPALLCLKQLAGRYWEDGSWRIRLFSHIPVGELFSHLDLFETNPMSLSRKLHSWLDPADKAFFLSTTSGNIGFHARTTYGRVLPNKKLVRYTVDLPGLSYPEPPELLPSDLVSFLEQQHGLTFYPIRQFSLCLELGFSASQIIDTFRFDESYLGIRDTFTTWEPPFARDFVVVCLEAGYSASRNSDRRWCEEHFIHLAEKVHADYGLESVFVGLTRTSPVPDREYFHDVRGDLTLVQLARLLQASSGYLGNDTGPLHIANLMKKISIGVYARPEAYYGPLFPRLNTVVMKPGSPEEIYPFLCRFVSQTGGGRRE